MSDSWIYEQIRTCAIAAHRGQFGVLSTGEQLAAALVLNRPDLLQVAGYSITYGSEPRCWAESERVKSSSGTGVRKKRCAPAAMTAFSSPTESSAV